MAVVIVWARVRSSRQTHTERSLTELFDVFDHRRGNDHHQCSHLVLSSFNLIIVSLSLPMITSLPIVVDYEFGEVLLSQTTPTHDFTCLSLSHSHRTSRQTDTEQIPLMMTHTLGQCQSVNRTTGHLNTNESYFCIMYIE